LNHVHAQPDGEVAKAAERSALTECRVSAGDHAAKLRRHVLEEINRLLTGILRELRG
jgi:hypothetical protein